MGGSPTSQAPPGTPRHISLTALRDVIKTVKEATCPNSVGFDNVTSARLIYSLPDMTSQDCPYQQVDQLTEAASHTSARILVMVTTVQAHLESGQGAHA